MTSNNTDNTDQLTPQTPVLTVACRILRSPSHESVTTDLSLFSVSSVASDGTTNNRKLLNFPNKSTTNPTNSNDDHQFVRGPSPNPPHTIINRPADIPEILWFEEETEVIRNCAALSSAVGLQKSFSTSDISQLDTTNCSTLINNHSINLRNAVSELALNSLQRSSGYLLLESARLDHTSRSCSTWVAVGDIASTSQLPSPHGGHQQQPPTNSTPPPPPPPPAFTAADFIRSVNKKVRQNYIRRRLLTTYKALERLSQSEFNLDRLEVTSSSNSQQLTRLQVPGSSPTTKPPPPPPPVTTSPSAATTATTTTTNTNCSSSSASSTNAAILRVAKQRACGKNLPLTIRDVERERGKPLSKYERNMMIFNWLHTLDDTAFVEGIQ